MFLIICFKNYFNFFINFIYYGVGSWSFYSLFEGLLEGEVVDFPENFEFFCFCFYF